MGAGGPHQRHHWPRRAILLAPTAIPGGLHPFEYSLPEQQRQGCHQPSATSHRPGPPASSRGQRERRWLGPVRGVINTHHWLRERPEVEGVLAGMQPFPYRLEQECEISIAMGGADMIDLDDLACFSRDDLDRDRSGSGPPPAHEP